MRKSTLFIYIGIVFMAGAIVLSYRTLQEVRTSKSNYLSSIQILTLSNDLDRLFKDIVYLPLVVWPQNAKILEQQKSDEIASKLLLFNSIVKNKVSISALLNEIQQTWNELRIASNPEKLNLLYNLELIHNSVDRLESKNMNDQLANTARNSNLLVMFTLILSFLAFVMLLLTKIFETKELQKVQTLLAQSQNTTKSMSTFLAIAGHELRTPLNGIIGLSEILRKSHLPLEETHYADNLYHSGKALLKIINNILEFSKLESGKVELENAKFSLGSVIQPIITIFASEARDKNIKFAYLIDEEVPKEILGDCSRISQILFHLIGNAVSFTMNGSVILKVKVISKEIGQALRLCFSVEDTGIGLSEEQLAKLLRPFTEIQLTGKIGEVYPGLSFAICNQLVKAMGGEFEIRSQQGIGSNFSFTACFSEYSKEKLGKDFLNEYHYFDSLHDIEPIFEKEDKPTILVVDDNPANLLMEQVMLGRLGAKVITATNGKEALYEFSKTKIDLVLMDCQMPVMNGYEAAKAIRQSHKIIPVLAMSATADKTEKDKCIEAGMKTLLLKPIGIETLVKELKNNLLFDPAFILDETINQLKASIGAVGTSRVLQSFLEDLPKSEQSIEQSLQQNDLDSLHRIGHRYKSSSLTVGAKGLSSIFKKLEKTQNIENVSELKDQIHSALPVLKTKIAEHIQHLQ
jgi:signal transduction histidine kinase/CheY-like chemotaxis protein/HPt (histidine-containing phosphotransfer) domain-containing protein